MSDAALQAALARVTRAPDDPESWRGLTQASRARGHRWSDLSEVAAGIAAVRGGERLEAWWYQLLQSAGWVAGEPRPPAPPGPFRAWALAPDGSRVAAAREAEVILWEGPGLRVHQAMAAPPDGEVVTLAFVEDQLAAITEGERRTLWEYRSGGWEATLAVSIEGRFLALDPGRRRVARGVAGVLHVTGPELSLDVQALEDPDAVLLAAAFAPAGDALSVLGTTGPMDHFRRYSCDLVPVSLPGGAVGAGHDLEWVAGARLAYTPDGSGLAITGSPEAETSELRLFSAGPGATLGSGEAAETPRLRGVVPGPGPREVTVLGQAASSWRLGEGLVETFPGKAPTAHQVAGGRLLLADEQGFVALAAAGGALCGSSGVPAALTEAGFFPGGERLWTCDEARVLRAWTWPSGLLEWARPLWRSHSLPWGGGACNGTFASIFHETRDLETGEARARRYHPEDHVIPENWRLADVSPRGDALLLISDTRRLRCLEAGPGQTRWRRKLPGESFGPVAYLPGESILAVLRSPGRAFGIDPDSGEVTRRWELPRDFDWSAPGWRLRPGPAAPCLVGPGAVRLEADGSVTALIPPSSGPCAVAQEGGRRARWGGSRVLVEEADGRPVSEVEFGEPPGILLLTPQGDGLLWSSGSAMRYQALP